MNLSDMPITDSCDCVYCKGTRDYLIETLADRDQQLYETKELLKDANWFGKTMFKLAMGLAIALALSFVLVAFLLVKP